ncbi:hypothetical protein ACQP0U_24050 [Micromonospora sp. CA-269861]|uniref:hypothetical protein n=1 Tax=Micromonospora sp. CA-269861 TaxID=3239968 RepID=UPI003D928DEF
MAKTRTQPRLRLTLHYRPRRDTHRTTDWYTCTTYELTPGWVILHNAQQHDWYRRPVQPTTTRLAIPTNRIAEITQH